MTQTSIGVRLAVVERRLAELEAREAIRDLLSRYGPAADACDAAAVTALWMPDGEYAFDDTVLTGEQLAGLVDLDGDRAVAVCHSVVFKRCGDAWTPARVSANRWEFARTESGWLVERRVNRLLNGSEAARALLAPSVSRTD